MFGADEFDAASVEGRREGQHAIAVGHVERGVAAIEGFHVGQGGGHPGAPGELAEACATKAEMLGAALVQGQGGECAQGRTVAAENFHLLGEAGVGHEVGVGADRADREEVLAAG